MALVKWDPWQDMLSAQRDMATLLRRFFGESWASGAPSMARSAFAPAVEVFTRGNDLVVRAELPGMDPEKDVDISLTDSVLTIRGERRQEEQSNGETFYRSETHYGALERQFVIPEHVDTEQIHATYTDGILEVVVPGAAALPPARKIPVQSGKQRKALTTRGRKK